MGTFPSDNHLQDLHVRHQFYLSRTGGQSIISIPDSVIPRYDKKSPLKVLVDPWQTVEIGTKKRTGNKLDNQPVSGCMFKCDSRCVMALM